MSKPLLPALRVGLDFVQGRPALAFELDGPLDEAASVRYAWQAGAKAGASGLVCFDAQQTRALVPIADESAGAGFALLAQALQVQLSEPQGLALPVLPDHAPRVAEAAALQPAVEASAPAMPVQAEATERSDGPSPTLAVLTPRISVGNYTVGEGPGAFVDVVVKLDQPGINTVTVRYDTASWNAATSSDYTDVGATLTFLSGETEKTVRVNLADGTTAESLEQFYFLLSSPTNSILADSIGVITIVDNDNVTTVPRIFVRDVIVDEKAGTASFVVTLGNNQGEASNGAVTVNYATANGTALAGSDYTATSGTLNFAAGESTKTVTVNILDDGSAEGWERFSLNLSNATGGAVIVDGSATADIGASDGTALSNTRIQVTDYYVDESQGYVDVVVSLSAPAQSAVSVRYFTGNGNATSGSDYGAYGALFLNWAPGETVKVVRIPIIEDTAAEAFSNFYLFLDTPSANATIVKPYSQISILDNDSVVPQPYIFVRDTVVDEKAGTATFYVQLGGNGGQAAIDNITVNFATANATATAGSDYVARSGTLTFAPGESLKAVVVDITDDTTAEGLERLLLNLSNATGGAVILDGQAVAEINANDATAVSNTRILISDMIIDESAGFVDVVVSLSAPAQTAVTVRYFTSNGTATTSDYQDLGATFLNFAPGETVKTVRLQILDDVSVENLENLYFFLDTPSANATIVKPYSQITLRDNDGIVDAPNVFVRDVVVDEKAGTATFVVSLGGQQAQASNSVITVDYATANATATAGSDYVARSGTLTFAPGESTKTVVVDITDDTTAEGLERFSLNLSNATGGAVILDGSAVAEIVANDATAVSSTRILLSDMVIDESQGYADVVVSLSAPAQTAVTVRYYTSGGTASSSGDYQTLSATFLNFAPGETSKVVRVQLYEDANTENLENFYFVLDTPSANATIVKPYSQITVVDNEGVVDAPGLFVRDVTVDEKAGTATFVVTLGNQVGQSSNSVVTVDYATANATATAGSDFVGRTGTLTFAPGESVKTVVVDITDDTTAEGLERLLLNLSNATGGAVIVDGQGVAEIGANDAASVATTRVSVVDMVVDESEGWVDVVVSLSAPAQQPVTVRYYTNSGSANTSDYQDLGTTFLNFAAGETTKTVRVQLLEDATPEQLSNFYFVMDTPSANATIAKAYSQITVLDNDTVVDSPEVYVRDTIVDEKAGTATFVVTLGNVNGQSSNSTVSVNFSTGSSTATAGSDFASRTGTLVFAPGESVKTVVVDLIDDGTSEGNERINLTLVSAVNATIVDSRAVAVIGASDAANQATPVITAGDAVLSEQDGFVDVVLQLSAPSTSLVSVNYSVANGTAFNGSDYNGVSGTAVFTPGQTTVVVRMQVYDDSASEATENFRLTLSSAVNATLGTTFATINLVDNDTPGVQVLSFGLSDDIYRVDDPTDLIVETADGGTDLVETSVNYTLPDNVENVRMLGAGTVNVVGNSLANTLYAGAGNNAINGGTGIDIVSYADATAGVTVNVALAGPQATGGSGTDSFVSVEYVFGSNFNDTLSAGAGINRIDGGLGADVMNAGAGNDTYIVDNAGDSIIEAGNGGNDTVNSFINYTLGNNLENLRIVSNGAVNGTGNAQGNLMYAGAGNNVLDGAGGVDTASYLFAASAVTVSLATTAAQATGGSGSDRLLNFENLTGSNAADNLTGSNAGNKIDGGRGADTMTGLGGNDIYIVDSAGDQIFESAGGGTDTVYSSLGS